MEGATGEATFHRIVSSYPLYDADFPDPLPEKLHAALEPDGVFFFCRPGSLNNGKLKRLHYGLKDEVPSPTTGGAAFTEGDGSVTARKLFSSRGGHRDRQVCHRCEAIR